MNATRRHAGEGGVGRATSDAAVRGALLIGVAVVIGLLLLWRAHDEPDSAADTITTPTTVAPGGNTDGSTPVEGGTTVAPTDTTAAPPVATTHPPAQVPVLVANGSGTPKGASTVTNKLIPSGYDTKPAADADQTYQQSRIYYREGFAEDAKAIATALGVPAPVESIIEAMPAEPPVQGANGKANAQQAQVLVLLGTDQVIKQT